MLVSVCVCVIARTALKSFRMQVRVLVCVGVCATLNAYLIVLSVIYTACCTHTRKYSYTSVDVAFASF